MTGGSYDDMVRGKKKLDGTENSGDGDRCGGTLTSSSSTTASASSSRSSSGSGTTTSSPSCIRRLTSRLTTLYSNLSPHEISGSCGDLGTFIPLVVSMARTRSIALSPALFFAGLSNILTGISWDVPMPVQPMKSIAAVAISEVWSLQETTTAGILTGGLILVIGTTYLIELINVVVPLPVVTGIQVGVGLRLMGKGMIDVSELPWVGSGDSILLAVIVSLLAMYWLREPRPHKKREDDENDEGNDTPREERRRRGLHHHGGVGSSSVSTTSGGGGEESSSSDSVLPSMMPPVDEGEEGEGVEPEHEARRQQPANDDEEEEDLEQLPTTTPPGRSRRRSAAVAGWWRRLRRYACCSIPSLSSSSRKDEDLPPHPVGVYLFLTGCIFAAVELATTDNTDDRPWR